MRELAVGGSDVWHDLRLVDMPDSLCSASSECPSVLTFSGLRGDKRVYYQAVWAAEVARITCRTRSCNQQCTHPLRAVNASSQSPIVPPPPLCISHALVQATVGGDLLLNFPLFYGQATVGVGNVMIMYVI